MSTDTLTLTDRRTLCGRYRDVNTGEIVDVSGARLDFARFLCLDPVDNTQTDAGEIAWPTVGRFVGRGTWRPLW